MITAPRRAGRLLAALVCLTTGAALLGTGSGADAAAPHSHAAAAQSDAAQTGARFLALGDSISFGYREATNAPTPDYTRAANFTGFPELIGRALNLQVINGACPGETTGSFITVKTQSNGCESAPGGGPGYRTAYPLHRNYINSQLGFSVQYLRKHPQTRFVTLMIGANDAFLCQETTSDHCASEQLTVLGQIQKNVGRILKTIRGRAGYTGQIILVTYYALDYGDADSRAQSQALDYAVTHGAAPYDVTVADGYGAFQNAAEQAGGDSCAAGLLTILSGGGCGVHPSVAGQGVLAQAVEDVIAH